MKSIHIRPVNPEHDFAQISRWFSLLEDDAYDEPALKDYYQKRQDKITASVAEGEDGKLLGFYWAFRTTPELYNLDLLVDPACRHQGTGTQLYSHIEPRLISLGAKRLEGNVQDSDADSLRFVTQRGFTERWHLIPYKLNLETFDDQPYDALIQRLQGEGFQFTSMEELGDTEEARRKLYALNDSAGLDIPGRNGEHTWATFEDFQQRVCQVDWYRPGGQKVVIDTATGEWVAMSAITRFSNHADNLFTGVDKRYRGRKLAQAVKVVALRYAREVLQVSWVHTTHNTMNQPMIAIDVKFGYVRQPGTFIMRKDM